MAIGQLGFGPCHQMTEIADAPDQHAFWQTQAEGQGVDWVEVFARYQSQVNFPGTTVWHALSIAFPDAKVLHTQRPEEA